MDVQVKPPIIANLLDMGNKAEGTVKPAYHCEDFEGNDAPLPHSVDVVEELLVQPSVLGNSVNGNLDGDEPQ